MGTLITTMHSKTLLSQFLLAGICLGLVVCDGEWGRRLPNIGYAGRGYDMFRANPRPLRSLIDPGYVAAVVNTIDRPENRMSGDGRYLLPDRVEVRECQSCQQSMDVSHITNLDDFKKATGTKVETGYKGWFSFGVRTSSTFEEVIKQTTELNHVLIDAEAECSYYCANVRVYEIGPNDLTLNFRRAVERLSTGHLSYNAFAWMFGTHFISRVKMGSMFWQRTVQDKTEWMDSITDTNTTEKAMRMFGGIQRKASSTVVTHDEEVWVDTLVSKSLSRDLFSTGTDLNRTSTWIEVAKNQPMPIGISLYPLTMLLTKKYFPTLTKIDEIRRNFESIVENGSYCEFLLRASLGTSDINGDCYKTKKPTLTPAARAPFVHCPTIFGGTYITADFTNPGGVKNYLTGSYNCPEGYTANPLMQITNRMSSGIFYCANDYHDPIGQFGGMYTSVTKRICRTEYFCEVDVLGTCVQYGEKKVDCKDREIVQTGDIYGYYLSPNAFTSISGCAEGYDSIKLSFIEMCTGPCLDAVLVVNINACYRSAGFIKGKSYLAGFMAFIPHWYKQNPSCEDGYSPKLIFKSFNTTDGYACINNP